MKVFGIIEGETPIFFFNQYKLSENEYGLKITNIKKDSEQGTIDTGFIGTIIIPKKYKAIVTEYKKILKITLANGDKIPAITASGNIAFLNNKFINQDILISKIPSPLMGIKFLKELEKVTFDFTTEEVYYEKH